MDSLDYHVIGRFDEIRASDLVIDSSGLPNDLGCFRVDHHVDNGWTNLDSVACADLKEYSNSRRGRIVTNYLDPDAVISAAVLSRILFGSMQPDELLQSPLGRVLYSAAFYSDYSIGFDSLPVEINELGGKLEAWLRAQMEARLGEDLGDEPQKTVALRSAVFRDLTTELADTLDHDRFLKTVASFDAEGWLETIRRVCARHVCPELATLEFGVLWVTDSCRRATPRAYCELFKQPVVVRAIQREPGDDQPKQVLIGVNPHGPQWRTLNLERLNAAICGASPNWRFNGRRFVIGTSGQQRPLADLMAVLSSVSLGTLRDSCPLWSVYES